MYVTQDYKVEVLEKVGNGGMATVYKAKCHILNRYVAIKILKEMGNQENVLNVQAFIIIM